MLLEEAMKEEVDRLPRTGIPQAKKKSIAVLTPTLGNVSMWWHTAITGLVWPMNTTKGMIPIVDRKGGEIGEMRNMLISMVLTQEKLQPDLEVEYVMWIDDDVIVNQMCMLQLLSHERDIVSGVYFCKGEPSAGALIFGGPSSGTLKFRPNETFEAWGWSQGLCLIKTDVYRRMEEELDLGKDKYGNSKWYHQPEFKVEANGSLCVGGTEDFPFFDNASKLGYRPLIDCTKFAFGWHYSMAEAKAYPSKQWDQYVRREPVIWPETSERGEVVWS